MKFSLIEFSKPVKFEWKLASFLNTSNQKKIVTEWFQQQKSFNRTQKHLSNYTKPIIHLRLDKYC